MLALARCRAWRLAGIYFLFLAAVTACGDEGERINTAPSATPAPSSAPVEGVDSQGGSLAGTPSYRGGESLRAMVETRQHIIVGRSTGISGTYARHVASDYMFDPPLPGIPFTVYSIAVIEAIWADGITAGEIISVLGPAHFAGDGSIQPGSEFSDTIEVGSTYLLFLGDSRRFGDPGLTSVGFTRFLISDDGRVTANGREFLAGVFAVSGVPFEDVQATYFAADSRAALAALKGQTLEEAKAKIQAAIDEGPLPFVCNAPVCTPSPTPPPTDAPTTAPLAEPSP